MSGACNTHVEKRNIYTTWVGKPAGKRTLGRHRRRKEDNIKIHLQELKIDGVDWIHLARDRNQWRVVVNTVINLWVT